MLSIKQIETMEKTLFLVAMTISIPLEATKASNLATSVTS